MCFFFLFSEIRTHGVGYYAFSIDEEKRTEQINLLNKLRDQVHVHVCLHT